MIKKENYIKASIFVLLSIFINVAVAQNRNVQVLSYSHGKYVGEVSNGKANGQGTYTASKSGAIYSGQFVNDTFNGNGTMIWANGDKFIGSWLNDSAVSGTMTFANGQTASGQVRNGNFIESGRAPIAPPAQSAQAPRGANSYGFNSQRYTIVFSCEDSYAVGRDAMLAENVIAALEQGPAIYSAVISNSTYASFCKPTNINMTNLSLLKNGRLYSRNNGAEYILIKQGNSATFGVVGR
jgi:hypothetical protein